MNAMSEGMTPREIAIAAINEHADIRLPDGRLAIARDHAVEVLRAALPPDGEREAARETRDEAMTFVPAWVRDALDFWFLHPGIEAADDLRAAIAEWYRDNGEPDREPS